MKTPSFLLLALSIFISPLCATAQTSDDLFNGDVLQEVRLTVNPRDWASLKANYETNNYYAVDFHWSFNGHDVVSPQVALRSRGAGSRSPIKPSLKIEFDRYESNDTFLGLRNLVLRADSQDASMMGERVSMALFRKLGIPAPREVHTRLYVNNQYAGLYTIVEEVDPQFLLRNFGQDGGYLYSYQYTNWFAFQDLGKDSSIYSPLPFKPESNFTKPDPEPIPALVQAVNYASDAQFETMVSQYVDLHSYVREIAAENFVAEQDGLIGNYGLNNFYFYRLEGTQQSVFIPWDKSNTFFSMNWPVMHNVVEDVLSRRALNQPDLLAYYQNELRAAADIAGGIGGWLEQEITKEYNQIRQAAYDDPYKLCDPGATGSLKMCTNDQFDAQYQFMLTFARQRADDVRSQLNSVRK